VWGVILFRIPRRAYRRRIFQNPWGDFPAARPGNSARTRGPGVELWRRSQIIFQGPDRCPADGNNPLLDPFFVRRYLHSVQGHESKVDQFGNSKAGGIEEFDHGPVAEVGRLAPFTCRMICSKSSLVNISGSFWLIRGVRR